MNKAVIITKPDDIERCRLLSIRQQLALEVIGMVGRVNVCAYVRRAWGIRKQKRKDVYFHFCSRAGVPPSESMSKDYPVEYQAYLKRVGPITA
jgi:hypothetical protein